MPLDPHQSDPFPKIVVSELDRGNIRTPHDDPLVVEMKIANLRVRRILIDTGSSTDIISADCLSRLKRDKKVTGSNLIHPSFRSGIFSARYEGDLCCIHTSSPKGSCVRGCDRV